MRREDLEQLGSLFALFLLPGLLVGGAVLFPTLSNHLHEYLEHRKRLWKIKEEYYLKNDKPVDSNT